MQGCDKHTGSLISFFSDSGRKVPRAHHVSRTLTLTSRLWAWNPRLSGPSYSKLVGPFLQSATYALCRLSSCTQPMGVQIAGMGSHMILNDPQFITGRALLGFLHLGCTARILRATTTSRLLGYGCRNRIIGHFPMWSCLNILASRYEPLELRHGVRFPSPKLGVRMNDEL